MVVRLDTLEVLDSSGHIKVTWDPEDPEEVARAREEVAALRRDGYGFFAVVRVPEGREVDDGGGSLEVRRVNDPTDPEEVDKAAEPDEPIDWTDYKGLNDQDSPASDEEVLPPEPGECTATKGNGDPCGRDAWADSKFCGYHQPGRKGRGGRKKGSKGKKKAAAKEGEGRRTVAVRQLRGG